MKIKHVQGEGMPMEALKRGRGRPKKDGYYASGPGAGGRLDPTNELFLRTEEREGGPIDPVHSFEDNVQLLFSQKYQSFSQHPMYSYLNQLSYSKTPGGMQEGNETETKSENDDTRKISFKDLTHEIQTMTEPRKNMLNCEELMCIYMRECSTQVNESYYSTIMQFLLMFRDCLNMYGW